MHQRLKMVKTRQNGNGVSKLDRGKTATKNAFVARKEESLNITTLHH